MPVCKRIVRKHRKVCIGDLNELICLRGRELTPPESGVDATEEFEDTIPEEWAMVETPKGETVFDGSNTEVDVTHKFTISFTEGITSETWVLFKDKHYDILNVENLEERDEWLILRCNDKGTTDNQANQA